MIHITAKTDGSFKAGDTLVIKEDGTVAVFDPTVWDMVQRVMPKAEARTAEPAPPKAKRVQRSTAEWRRAFLRVFAGRRYVSSYDLQSGGAINDITSASSYLTMLRADGLIEDVTDSVTRPKGMRENVKFFTLTDAGIQAALEAMKGE